LLPGAGAAGIAAYVDEQLGRANPFFALKYMDTVGPYRESYRGGLAALERLSMTRHGQGFQEASPEQRAALVGALAKETPAGWEGPPAPLFYFVVRSDAVDVVYGTRAGFERLGIPYLAHDVPNLWVTGSSLFTTDAVNPTFTLYAAVW
jgi:hypothetical protein